MATPCLRPALNALDPTQQGTVGDQYAMRHNPFKYFAAITSSPDCARKVVDPTRLSQLA